MTQLLGNNTEIQELVLRLASNRDFVKLVDHWRVTLATMYSEVCSQPHALGRDWYAGKAALLEMFLKNYDRLTQERTTGLRGRQVQLNSDALNG